MNSLKGTNLKTKSFETTNDTAVYSHTVLYMGNANAGK